MQYQSAQIGNIERIKTIDMDSHILYTNIKPQQQKGSITTILQGFYVFAQKHYKDKDGKKDIITVI